MKLLQIKFISILHFINLIYFSHQQQQNIIQSDKILIKNVQEVWESTKIGGNQSRNYNLDISSGKFKNQPKIAYALTVYNADNCSNQGFKLSTNTITVSKLNYKLSSLGCDLTQLAFNVLFLDDPRVEIQQKELSSGVPSTIIGTQDILEIAPFIYGFKGNSSGNLILKYTLTKVDSRNYKILFSNQNVPTVYLNIIIVYQNVSQDKFEQLYSYQTNFDTQGKNIGGSSTVAWKTSTKMDLSPIFFGLKDFSITSNGYFGIKIQSGQSPEAQNKLVHLNYFTWNDYYVNLINGIWMGFSLTTCKLGYTMFLNSTFNACVQSCNTVDHHYNTNSANTQPLYSTSMIICQECNSNCYGCKDGSPHVCTDCYNGIFLNPFTNTCDSVKPASTFCSTSTIAGQTFQNCLKCDSTCKECKAANHSKSCTSCNINSQNKYFYQNQCLTQQPPSTYCNNAFICNNCDPNCVSCSDSSYNCLSCKAGSYLYQNQCLGQICQQNQYLNPFTNKCELTQPAGTSCSQITTNNSTFFNCQKCDPTCKECSSPFNATSCTSCNVSSQDKYFYNQECLKSQPEKTYCDSSFICHQCDANCSQCSQSSSNCQSCITDKYLYGNKCLDIACQNNEYLNGITQKCEQAQPSGTYCNPVTQNGKNFYFCQKCDSSCKECKSPGDSKSCTICDSYSINKYYYQNQCLISQPPSTFCDQNLNCQDCNSKCISCSQSSTNCQICQSNIYFYQNQCLENPLPGTYCKSYTDCHQCDKNCKTCIDTSTNCTSCQDQQYLFQNKCYPERPNGVYCEQENKSFKCEVCSGQNCKECLLNDSSKCTSCNTNEYLYQDKCFSSQPDSTFCKNSICQSCHQSCKSCVGISDNNCTECQDNQNRILEILQRCL